MVDATCGVVAQINDKRVFYFAIIIHNGVITTEPVPVFQFLTDKPDEQSFSSALNLFICDEKKRYGYLNNTTPSLAICDLSWPLIKALLLTFNQLKLHEYIEACFKVLSGNASEKELPTEKKFLIIQLCLSHTMKMFSYHTKRALPKSHRKIIMNACSITANSKNLGDFKEAVTHLFTMLLSEQENVHTKESKNWIENQAELLGEDKNDLQGKEINDDEEISEDDTDSHYAFSEDPREEDKGLIEQCKRSRFYKIGLTIFNDVAKKSKALKGRQKLNQ